MLQQVDETYRGHGIVWLAPRRGKLQAFVFPALSSSSDAFGPALFDVPSATLEEGRDVLRARVIALIDGRAEQ